MLRKRRKFFENLLLLADLAAVAGAWIAAYGYRFFWDPVPVRHGVPPLWPYLFLLMAILLLCPLVFRGFRLYRPRRIEAYFARFGDIVKASTALALLVTALTFFFRQFEYSRLVVLYFWVFEIVGLCTMRALFRMALRAAREKGNSLQHALVVGWGDVANELVHRLRAHPELWIDLKGSLVDQKEHEAAPSGVPVLGGPDTLPQLLEPGDVGHVFIALPLEATQRLPEILKSVNDFSVDITVVPDFSRYVSLGGGVDELEGLAFIRLQGSRLHGWGPVVKRGFDVLAAGIGLTLLSPMFLFIALMVKLTSRGPVFYRQERMGLDGRTFAMIKFRSMYHNAEENTGPVWADSGDPRRTRLGALLRTTSLDELPQLWNVLKGEMSLVGPRPERPVFINEFRKRVPGYMLRHKMKAGITGWAQVNGWRGSTSLAKRIEHDLYYIEHWSLLFDLKILFLTLFKGLVSRNAY